MFEKSFNEIDVAQKHDILNRLNPKLDGAEFDLEKTRLIGTDLSFYNGYDLMEASDHDMQPPRKISFLYNNQTNAIHILDDTNAPVYELNASVPVFLNNDTVKDYVRFFFCYVRGAHGRFHITEGTEEINWREDPDLSAKRALGKMIDPLEISKISDQGVYTLNATIIFKNHLFDSQINVDENGMVELHNQELLVDDIPVVDDNLAV